MTPRKLSVLFAFPSYGGNGGIASEHPDIRRWYTRTINQCDKDERISAVHETTRSDTPITMVRNKFVTEAREIKADVLVMCDSDQAPDLHLIEAGVQEFFPTSFDFLYNHYEKGPCVIGAPYCGPPGNAGSENMYVFLWQNSGDHGHESIVQLEQVPRMMACRMQGIQECAALPTGLIMYDMRAFDLIEPCHKSKAEILEDLLTGKITKNEALRCLHEGFFYYQWKNNYADEKVGTEDVCNTRDISLAGIVKLGYNPVFCNWDAPVGHWKPWCVRGRPLEYDAQQVAATFRQAVLAPLGTDEVIADAAQFTGGCHGKR